MKIKFIRTSTKDRDQAFVLDIHQGFPALIADLLGHDTIPPRMPFSFCRIQFKKKLYFNIKS